MTTVKNTRKALLMSAVSLLLCFAMLLGTTFAWFTDSAASGSNVITSGNLDVEMYWADGTAAVPTTSAGWTDASTGAIFDYKNWEPGYVQVRHIKIANEGSLAFKYKVNIVANGTVSDLANVIDVYYVDPAVQVADRTALASNMKIGTLAEVLAALGDTGNGTLKAGESDVITLALKMQESAGNEYMNKSIGTDFSVQLFATQLASETDSFGKDYDKDSEYPAITDTWNGTTDISWYTDNPTAAEFSLSSAEQLAGLASLMDGTAVIPADVSSKITLPVTFEGKTVKLTQDVDLYAEDENGDPICFEPIGGCRSEAPFMGTFDGQGHTVSNMSQNTWALNNGYYYSGELGIGLFGAVEDAVIKNLVVDGASISGESALCGAVAGVAMGDCTFENITVKNAQVNDYQYGAGGIVGWASGNQTYKGINVDETTVVGSQWGDFGNANGGIIGQAATSGTYHFEDCTVACRIDATNDIVSAYQWHCYRNSGMLIGKVDDYVKDEFTDVVAENVTCTNVTVIYNDWANYTYCEFAGTGYPYVRVQAGVSVDAYSNVRYGHPTDANGNTVVDDNHVHNDGEDHQLLLVFDQLFGGPANHRYCYYGIATHPGVTVIYNNK